MSTISDPYLPGGVQRPDGGRRPYLVPSTIPQIPTVLHRRAPRRTPVVLQFGGKYIHCGEPMQAAGSRLGSIFAPMTTEQVSPEQTSTGVLEVYLRTRVLRCGCGFQMEYPSNEPDRHDRGSLQIQSTGNTPRPRGALKARGNNRRKNGKG